MESELIRFGDVVIDRRTREVRRGGEAVAVQKKVFELLVYLVDHRDRAVGKEELQDRVWPGMIVTETALTRAIMKARRAVGDDSDRQAVIRTVHGHGYRFVAPLEREEAEAPAPVETTPGRAIRPRTWGMVGTVALLALVAVAALLTLRPGRSADTRIAVLPISDRTGDPELAWTGLGLMSYVNRLLAESVAGDTVTARRVMAAAESLTPDPSVAELQSLREKLGASHLLHTSLVRAGDTLSLEYRVVHQRGAGPPGTVSGEDATALAREMARAVVSGLPGAGLRRDFRTVSGDPFVNEAYARGLSLQLKGEVAKARDYFAVAVRQEPDLFWPRYELALTMRDTGELGAARDELETLAGRAATSTDLAMRAAANNALAQVYWRLGDHGRADAAYQAALAAARAKGDVAAESTILVNRGILARINEDLEGARRHLAAALAATERSGHPERASIYQSLGQVEWKAGELPLAMDYFRRARDAFRVEGNRRGMAASLNAMGRVERRMGRYAKAESYMLETLAERERLGDYFGRHSSLLSLAELYRDMERWDAAVEHADRAVAIAEGADDPPGVAEALRARVAIALAMGDTDTARDCLTRLASEFADDREEPEQSLLEARLALAEGRTAVARDLAGPVVDHEKHLARIDALDVLAAATRDTGEARRYWNEALAIARDHRERGREGRLLLVMARRELAEGNLDRARANADVLEAEFGDWEQVAALRQRLAVSMGLN